MAQNNRKEKVLKNVGSQMRASLIQSIVGFAARKFFLDALGADLLGLNSLMNSILGMLSLVELGVGEAINFSLYEPLAKEDHQQVAAIMRLYRKLYIAIGAVIVLLGAALFPFLHLLVETAVPMSTVYKAFGLFLLNNFLSYCMAYNCNIISADQRDYLITNVDTISQVLMNLVQIGIVLITGNYYLFLLIQICFTLLRNVYITLRARKMYPYMFTIQAPPLSKEYTSKLLSNIKALFVIKFAVFCVSGTDNMLLSSFVSLTSVAVYANYVTILTIFNKTFNVIFSKANSVIGNYLVLEDKEHIYPLFKNIFFVNFLVTSFTSIGILVVCNQVITVWLGPDMIWGTGILALIVFNNYSRHILQTCEAFRSAAGLYSPRTFVKYLALLEGLLNLVASVALIFLLENKVAAVFIGTAISTLVSTVAVPWIVYRFLFHRPLREFFVIYLRYFVIMLAALLLSGFLFGLLLTGSAILNVVIGIAVCSAVTGGLYLLIFHRTSEFKYALDIAKRFLLKKKSA